MFGSWLRRESDLFLGKQKDSIFFLGVDTKNREIWLNSSMLRQHVLVSGSTGSGKSEVLMGMMSNAFAWGSGGVYIDGKGDVSVYGQMFAMAEHHGRLGDLFVLNFLSGSSSGTATMRTHRFNPFAKGHSDFLTSFVVSLMPPQQDGVMLKGKSFAMFAGVMRALCWMRDTRQEQLDASVLFRAISLPRIIDMATSDHYSFLPDPIRRNLRSYLSSLPDYDEGKGRSQSQVTAMHHETLEMPFARIFSDMSETYGHIFCAGTSDIDFEDIISNQRFVHVMLPAMEKVSDELSLLGRIVLSSIKHAIGEVTSRKVNRTSDEDGPLNVAGAMPFLSVFDDVSYYMIDGQDLLSAQARSAGMAIVYSCSDMHALSKVSKATFGDIASCAATKMIMTGHSPQSELNDVFFNVIPARDDVTTGVERLIGARELLGSSPRGSLFRSPFNVVKQLSAGEFVLINSGKMLLGSANYIWSFLPRPTRLVGPANLYDIKAAARSFVALSNRAERGESLQQISPQMRTEFITPHEQSMSAVQMLSHALKSLEPAKSRTDVGNEDEIIRIGA